MSNDIEVTEEQIAQSRKGILMRLQLTDIAKGYGSFAEAMEATGMWAFVDNMAEVQATSSVFNQKLYNIIHTNTGKAS